MPILKKYVQTYEAIKFNFINNWKWNFSNLYSIFQNFKNNCFSNFKSSNLVNVIPQTSFFHSNHATKMPFAIRRTVRTEFHSSGKQRDLPFFIQIMLINHPSSSHHSHTTDRERERAASEDDCSAVVPKRSPLCLHTEITVQSSRSFAWSSTARRSSPPSGLQIRLNRADFVDPPGSCGLSRGGFFTKRRRDVSSTIYLFYRFFNVSKYIIPAIVRPNELVDVINHIPFWFGCGGVPFPKLDRWMETFYGRLLVFFCLWYCYFLSIS